MRFNDLAFTKPVRGMKNSAPALSILLMIGGCTPGSPGGSGGDDAGSREVADQVLSLTNNFRVSGRGSISVQYSVAPPVLSVTAFCVQVEAPVAGSPDRGEPMILATDLAAGTGQSFNLDYSAFAVGSYQVGLRISRTSGTTEIRTTGCLVIESLPDPVFLAPVESVQVGQGGAVAIAFNNRKSPPSSVRWRLFRRSYDTRDGDLDGVPNTVDQCPQTSVDERGAVDAFGCGPSQSPGGDYDADGVSDDADLCPGTVFGRSTDASGCAEEQLGAPLSEGAGNENSYTWLTNDVAPGHYQIGVSATDAERSLSAVFATAPTRVVTRFAPGLVSVDTPSPPPSPPTLAFSSPVKDVATFLDETVTFTFKAAIRTPGATGVVDIFLDRDNTPGNGNEIMLLNDAPVSTTSVLFHTGDLAEALYFVGGTVTDTVNPPVTVYATGRLDVVKNPALTLSAPDSPMPVRPGARVTVAWTTNVPSHAGRLDVAAQRLGDDGEPEGAEIVIRQPGPPLSGNDEEHVAFNDSGVYRILVRIAFLDADLPALRKAAPSDVRVTTLPATLWTGWLALDQPPIDGAIIEGANFEDNLGTAAVSVPDLDGDEIDEWLIAARHGKPEFKNPNGVGEGEAYLIYGSAQRLTGKYSANRIGADLTGITFSGIRTRGEPANREQTQGLASIAVLPDVDFDLRPELVFGFTRTRSRGHNKDPLQDGLTPDNRLQSLERANQFLRGGVVIVSSTNSNLRDPSNRSLSPVIRLDLVGQQFENMDTPFSGAEGQAFADYRSPSPCYFEMETPCECPTECPDGGECPPDQRRETECMDYCGTPMTCSDLCQLAGAGCGDPDPNTPCHECTEWEVPPCDRNPMICDLCWGDCNCPQPDGLFDAMSPDGASTGFVSVLADSWFTRFFNCDQGWDCRNLCVLSGCHAPPVCDFVFDPLTCPDPLHENNICRYGACFPFKPVFTDVGLPGQSGFYIDWIIRNVDPNDPLEPYGGRIIGLSTYGGPEDGDHFGASLSISYSESKLSPELLISAPDRRRAIPNLALNERGECVERTWDGEVANMLDADGDGCPDPIDFPGFAYLISFKPKDVFGERETFGLWERDHLGRFAPKPHQYVIGTPSHCDSIENRIDNPEARRFIGQDRDRIRNVLGIADFNRDGREDILIGVPQALDGRGRAYIAYRRDARLEGDYVLGKLALPPNHPERLEGLLIVWSGAETAAFGASLASGFDFNHDGAQDLVISAPGASVTAREGDSRVPGVGQVIIVFSASNLLSPQGGITVDELIRTGRAVRITGNAFDENGGFGFNVANAGDLDRDGYDDLLIAAPGATPRFDSTPTDSVDALTEPGLDLDFDGRRDDLAARYGLAGFDNAMTRAGVVYVISGANDFSRLPSGEVSVLQLGSDALRGLVIAGRWAGDHLGGGDAGDVSQGGNQAKLQHGRSLGLAGAGDLDGDGYQDLAIGAILADPRRDRITGEGVRNAGEMYLIYGATLPPM